MPHFNALARGDPCRYRHKWYTAKNYILWPTFLLQKVSVYLQPLLCNPPRKLPNSMNLRSRYGLLRRSRSFTVTEFGTNRKLICDFLLVINTNLYHCIVSEIWPSKGPKSLYLATLLGLTKGFPWDDLLKFFTQRSGMAKAPHHGIETLPKISIAWVGCTNISDDRQVNGRTMTYCTANVHVR